MENLDVTLQRPIDGNFCTFYWNRVPDKLKEKKLNRPSHKWVPYVKIKSPEMHNQVVDKHISENVLEEWEFKFPQPASFEYMKAYKDFMSLEHKQEDGYPLSEWQEITRSKASDLIQFGITTVEVLAATPDDRCGVGQGRFVTMELRDKAKVFLKGDDERKVRADQAIKNDQISALQTQLANSQSDVSTVMDRLATLEKKLELANDMPGRTGRDGDNETVSDSGVKRPNRSPNLRTGKKKSQRGRKTG